MRNKRIRPVLLILLLFLTAGGLLMRFIDARWIAAAEAASLRETTEQLDNPDRGFYLIHGLVISDGMDPVKAVEESFEWDWGRRLALVELSLREYTDGEISRKGLDNLDAVFDGLRKTGMRYIIRFVYDWDGLNMENEPISREIICRHMEQVAPAVNENADIIYTLQGLFVGNWGEMNGTRYVGTENWRALAKTLAEKTDPSVFLAVRMPMQWRRICGESEAAEASPGIRKRMGLFNDGMLGSYSDLGTYGNLTRGETDYDDVWVRTDELSFQEKLCRTVPNGGEAVFNEEYCTLETALDYLRTAHVSYLNEDYDRRLLDRWASETVEGGVWDGTDGLSYIKNHLGYRFTAEKAVVQYSYLSNRLSVSVDVNNVGFAPAYFSLRPVLAVLKDGEERLTASLSGDISVLWGGNEAGPCSLEAELSVSELEPGDYELALRLESDLGRIAMANEGRTASGDIIIGRIRGK